MVKHLKCSFHPGCGKTFASAFSMKRHVKTQHKNAFVCPVCVTMRLFSSSQSLRNHISIHKRDPVCQYCMKTFQQSYVYQHEVTCIERPQDTECAVDGDSDVCEDVEAYHDADTPTPRAPEPVFVPEPSGITRSQHSAPRFDDIETHMDGFNAWIRNPGAAGKPRMITAPQSFMAKFRTVLGRIKTHFDIDDKQLFYRMNRSDTCAKMFSVPNLLSLMDTLRKTTDGRLLETRTLSNYVRHITLYFTWKVNSCGKTQFRGTLDALEQVGRNLSVAVVRAPKYDKKAAHVATLPSVPDFLGFIKGELRDKAVHARINFTTVPPTDAMDLYLDLRNYILVALLFGVPPQRAQVYNTLKTDDITFRDDKYTILRVEQHKTCSTYGSAVVALPPYFYEEFRAFVDARDELALVFYDNNSLFIGADGKPERHLTSRFQKLVNGKFGVNVTLRDCRNIYVTYAAKHLDLKQLYNLARQMCHSFQTQQFVYRSEDSIQRAIDLIHSTNALTSIMPLCDLDGDDYAREYDSENTTLVDSSLEYHASDEESKDCEDYFDTLDDESLMEFVVEYNSQNARKI